MEDLGRIVRRVHAQLFCEAALDAKTRVITLNDQIDTAREEWRVLAGFACMRHELYNADTSNRIIRTQRNRFMNGGILQQLIFGLVKKPGATTDADVYRDPAAQPVYDEVFRLLDGGATYAEIHDWLVANGVKPGEACRGGEWTPVNAAQWLHNPAIKGLRVRNARMAVRVNKTGKRKTVAAPPEHRRERDNLVQAIRVGGHSAVLLADLKRVEADLQEAADRKAEHDVRERRVVRRPSREELLAKAKAAFTAATADTPELGRLLGRLLPALHVWPVRLWTGGRSGPRVTVRLDLATLFPDTRAPAGLEHVLRPTLTVNLFTPPEPEQFRARVVELTAAGWNQRKIAAEVDAHQATVPRAVALPRAMDARGTTDPYETLRSPPDDDGRWRRHRHPRYQFDPRPGYPMPPRNLG